MRPGVRSARSGPKSVPGNTAGARDAAGGRLGATRRAALSMTVVRNNSYVLFLLMLVLA